MTVSRVLRLAKATLEETSAPADKRGKHLNRPQKMTDEIKHQVDTHIRSFPTMKSHYSRKKHSRHRKYLSPQLSVTQMHELYVQKYEPNAKKPLVTYSFYWKYFNENFNITFGYPRSDTCGMCDQLEVQLDAASAPLQVGIRKQKEDHLRRAEAFYGSLRSNTVLSKQNSHISTITFDFQQNLPLPSVPVGDVFYMQQLWIYVFGVHNCGTNEVRMYCWPETIAHRGSDEVISCLLHYLHSLPGEVTTLNLFSDGCPGQNKNLNVMHFLFSLVRLGRFEHIRHFFPVRGHSFLPNDRDFGCTERKKRKVERVYTPEQWHDIMRSARKKKPYIIVPVDQSMVLNCAAHFSPVFKKTVKAEGKGLNIQRAMILDYSNSHPSEVWVKYGDEDEEWSKFSPEKCSKVIKSLPTAPKYLHPLSVKQNKISDVHKLVDKYVPVEFQSFYKSIKGDDEVSSETEDSGED